MKHNPSAFEDHRPVILLVEDDVDYRIFIATGLEDQYEIITAVNGREGLEKALNHMPDLVITDVMMPYMDGMELCKKLKTHRETSHIQIFMLTARSAVESQIEGFETGADEYVTKPFDMDLLKARLRSRLENRRMLIERFSSYSSKANESRDSLSPDQAFLKDAFIVLRERASQPDFLVEQFAEELNISVSSLHRKIKALTGETPARLIWNARLESAAELLRSSDLRITEIVYAVGFAETSHFSRQFRQCYGMTPSEYRAANFRQK